LVAHWKKLSKEKLNMTEKVIKRSIWINASRSRVWQAVNDPEQVAQWFLPTVLNAQMKRDADNKTFILMGPIEVPVMTFEAADQPHKVTIRGLPDMLITATYDLEEEKGGTLVTITMGGFESLSEDAYEERVGPSSAGWEKALENLKAYSEGSDLPFPQGYVAALLGYRLETGANYAVERSIWLNAPCERVWQAITDPEQIQQWYSPNTPWRLSALEVGGRFATYNAETDSEQHIQIVEVVDPPHQLILRSAPQSAEEVHDVTTYTLLEENGGTRLILTNAGYELETAEIRHQNMEQNAFGFGMALENLQAYLTSEDLPYPFGF
jgi:uncharacterized protein YndB with AHSA1/START domain